jgi:hypothetical protein
MLPLAWIDLPLLVVGTSLLFRLRGGLLGPQLTEIFSWWGSTPARILFWGIGIALISWLVLNNWVAALALLVLNYGDSVLGWWNSLGEGGPNGTFGFSKTFWLMAARGLLWVVPFAAVYGYLGHTYYWFALGIVCPLCYQLSGLIVMRQAPANRDIIPYGELFFGAIIGLSCWLSLYL